MVGLYIAFGVMIFIGIGNIILTLWVSRFHEMNFLRLVEYIRTTKVLVIKAITTKSPIPKMKVNDAEVLDDRAIWEAEMRSKNKGK